MKVIILTICFILTATIGYSYQRYIQKCSVVEIYQVYGKVNELVDYINVLVKRVNVSEVKINDLENKINNLKVVPNLSR